MKLPTKIIAPTRRFPYLTAALGLVVLISLAGCNLPAAAPVTPTVNITQAYETVSARLTEAVARTPLSTITPTPAPSDTPLPPTASPELPSATPTQIASAVPTGQCDQAAPGNPIDVNIPDDTKMQPGEEFTKTWRLVNIGGCSWTRDYALAWFSGEQLGAASSVQLSQEVASGQTVDLSVEMTAPQAPGTYISYWKLRNAAGSLFGIGPSGGSAFWVQIVVVASGTSTSTATAGTTTPTVTPTSGVKASGPATLEPGDVLDLDTNRVNSGDADVEYQVNDQSHVLAPVSSAAFAVFGNSQPSLNDCQTLPLNADPLAVDGLEGAYLCYRTNMALPGWAKLVSIDSASGALNLEIFTWAIP